MFDWLDTDHPDYAGQFFDSLTHPRLARFLVDPGKRETAAYVEGFDAHETYGGGTIAADDSALWALAYTNDYTSGFRQELHLSRINLDTLAPVVIYELAQPVVSGQRLCLIGTHDLVGGPASNESRYVVRDGQLIIPMDTADHQAYYVVTFDLATRQAVSWFAIPSARGLCIADDRVFVPVCVVTREAIDNGYPSYVDFRTTRRFMYAVYDLDGTVVPLPTGYPSDQRYGSTEYRTLRVDVFTTDRDNPGLGSGIPGGSSEYAQWDWSIAEGGVVIAGVTGHDIAVRKVGATYTVLAAYTQTWGTPGAVLNSQNNWSVPGFALAATESGTSYTLLPDPQLTLTGTPYSVNGALYAVEIVDGLGLLAYEHLDTGYRNSLSVNRGQRVFGLVLLYDLATGAIVGTLDEMEDVPRYPLGDGTLPRMTWLNGSTLHADGMLAPPLTNSYLMPFNAAYALGTYHTKAVGPIDVTVGRTRLDGKVEVVVGTTWRNGPYVIYPTPSQSERLSVVVDRKLGLMHVAYVATDGAIYYTRRVLTSEVFSAAVQIVAAGYEPALSIDPDGSLRVDYRTATDTDALATSRDHGRTWD